MNRVRLGLEAKSLTAVVKAWDLTSPPDYMVALAGGTKEDIRFYTSTNALPDGGLANRIYAADRIVFRKIPAAGVKWRKGITATQCEKVGQTQRGRNRPFCVTLTKDYYMAIYPLTQRQASYYFDVSRCSPTGLNAYGHPWNGYSFDEIRGREKGALWPALGLSETEAHQVDEKSLLHAMRTQLGISTIDLPTHAQWEFACRAGTGTNFYNGEDSVTEAMTSRGTLYGWSKGFASGQPQPVGLLSPNPWGLYDMTGNVYTWALDIIWDGNKSGDDEIDPRGPDTRGGNLAAGSRFWLGGFVGDDAKNYHTANATGTSGNTTGRKEVGVRLVCSADMSELR
jgi:formylglycine-generating enzyme required for sulfatase activity